MSIFSNTCRLVVQCSRLLVVVPIAMQFHQKLSEIIKADRGQFPLFLKLSYDLPENSGIHLVFAIHFQCGDGGAADCANPQNSRLGAIPTKMFFPFVSARIEKSSRFL